MQNINQQCPTAQRRSTWLVIQTLCLGLAVVGVTTTALAANTAPGLPGA